MRNRRVIALSVAVAVASAVSSPSRAQELPHSGVAGVDLVYATDPGGATSQLFAIDAATASAIPLGAPVANVPSRWAHRRRTMGALETAITLAPPLLVLTPMGDAVGRGAIHVVDLRSGTVGADFLVPTGNPAGYDLALAPALQFVFSAEDDGTGGTLLRGFSYATVGALVPLNPATIRLPGPPAAYVNRIGVDHENQTLAVATAKGIALVAFAPNAPQMRRVAFVSAGSCAPTTNPAGFARADGRIGIVGTSAFDSLGRPVDSGFLAWRSDGSVSWSASFGDIPGRTPVRRYAPAIGAEELAIVGNGRDAYVYSLLRDPDPNSGFVRASAVGAICFVGTHDPRVSKVLCPDPMGEPFSIPSVHGTRVAIESSCGPPWWPTPPGGAEMVNILYSPLDPIGMRTPDGVLGVAAPLGGRVSVQGMDRPLWTDDGRGVVACTSNFPGAPNPGIPGIEFLAVPADTMVDDQSFTVTVVDNSVFPNQSILMPSAFVARDRLASAPVHGLSFVGTVFHDGLGSLAEGRIAPLRSAKDKLGVVLVGQKQLQTPDFVLSPDVPGFPSILPASLDDASGSLVPIPAPFGARRVSFDLHPTGSLLGMTMVAALDDAVYVQPTGYNVAANLAKGVELAPVRIALPAGWTTTSEIASW
jgi:hypothetical protein